MNLWTDVSYVYDFAYRNKVVDIDAFVTSVLHDAEVVQDLLDKIEQSDAPLSRYFIPLNDAESKVFELSLHKGKVSRNRLRLYAVKVPDDCFVITGGAIKMSQTMQEHPDTDKELGKLRKARFYLRQNGVIDEDSFFEFLSESI